MPPTFSDTCSHPHPQATAAACSPPIRLSSPRSRLSLRGSQPRAAAPYPHAHTRKLIDIDTHSPQPRRRPLHAPPSSLATRQSSRRPLRRPVTRTRSNAHTTGRPGAPPPPPPGTSPALVQECMCLHAACTRAAAPWLQRGRPHHPSTTGASTPPRTGRQSTAPRALCAAHAPANPWPAQCPTASRTQQQATPSTSCAIVPPCTHALSRRRRRRARCAALRCAALRCTTLRLLRCAAASASPAKRV